jgi:hypothetical protein
VIYFKRCLSPHVLKHLACGVLATTVLAGWGASPSAAQNLVGAYDGPYSIRDLGSPANVPGPVHGGLCFLDPDTLLVAGNANTNNGAIYKVTVTRNASNQVNGFVGPAVKYKNAPWVDSGMTIDSSGVLFATERFNGMWQYKVGGGVNTKKYTNLNQYSLALQFVPPGFPGAGGFRGINYDGDFYTANLSPDGNGTYNVSGVSIKSSFPTWNNTGLVYIPVGSPVFNPANRYALVPEYGSGSIYAYQLNASGWPINAGRSRVVDGWYHAAGMTMDPLTNDVLVEAWGDRKVLRISGFNPPAGVIIRESGSSTRVKEGAVAPATGANDTYTVVLNSQPTGNVTITITPDPQVWVSTAAIPVPPTTPQVAPLVLTFTGGAGGNWNVPQTVFVTATDDLAIEGPHTGRIRHTAASADVNYNSIAVVDVVPIITDNDAPPGVTVTPTTVDVEEGGYDDAYQVVLNSDPGAGNTVTISVNPGTQVRASTATLPAPPTTPQVAPLVLTFTGGALGDWDTPQTVIVNAVDDRIVEGPHIGIIAHTAVSGSAAYNGIAVASVTVNITDNDSNANNEGSFAGSDGPPGENGSFGLGGSRRRGARVLELAGPLNQPGHYRVSNISHRRRSEVQNADTQGSGNALASLLGTGLAVLLIAAFALKRASGVR